MSARTKWIGLIVTFLVANIVATSVLIALAHRDASIVLPSYHEPASRVAVIAPRSRAGGRSDRFRAGP